jgi:hypothetical protein
MAAYRGGGYEGVGFVLSADDGFTALDLDNCRDPESGLIAPWAQQIIDTVKSYAEVSPGGAGIRVLVKGTKPGDRCRRASLEMYGSKRYVSMTGHHIHGTPETIESRQEELATVYREHLDSGASVPFSISPSPTLLTDDQVIEKASRSRDGNRFRALFFDGDASAYDGDLSRADIALSRWLAFFCGPDPDRIIRLMRQSALVREKWNRADYLRRTVGTVLTKQSRYYQPGQGAEWSNYSVSNSPTTCEHIQNNSTMPACRGYFQGLPCRRHGPRLHLRSTRRPGFEAALRPACRRRNCIACLLTLKQRWMERLHCGIYWLELTTVHAWSGSKDRWNTVSRRIRRNRGCYFGIRHGRHHKEVFALCSLPVEGSEALAPEEALDRMAAVLRPLRGFEGKNKERTLVCSRKWSKVSTPRKWTREGDVPASSEHLESTLIAEQARNPAFRAVILEPGQAAVWEFPDEMPEAERARVDNRILGNTLAMNSGPIQAAS